MKFFVILLLLLQFVTSLHASKYSTMKKEAYTLYESGKKEKSLTVVKKFIKIHPKSISAQNLLATLYYWQGDFSNSKKILHKILNKNKFTQSVALLKNIESKEAKRSKKVDKKVKRVVETKVNSISANDISSLEYFVNKVKKDPNDIVSRKVLAKHYEMIGNSKQATYFANAALVIDPDDSEMIALLKSQNQISKPYTSKSTVKRALKKLEQMYAEKSYNRFMNLYISLENNNVVMPTQIHVNALYSAIELKQYEKAKSILHIYRMPKTKYISQVEVLLDEKLMLSRFAQNCSGLACPVSR